MFLLIAPLRFEYNKYSVICVSGISVAKFSASESLRGRPAIENRCECLCYIVGKRGHCYVAISLNVECARSLKLILITPKKISETKWDFIVEILH